MLYTKIHAIEILFHFAQFIFKRKNINNFESRPEIFCKRKSYFLINTRYAHYYMISLNGSNNGSINNFTSLWVKKLAGKVEKFQLFEVHRAGLDNNNINKSKLKYGYFQV